MYGIVVEANQVRVDGGFGANAVVRNVAAREPTDAPNVTFKVFEQWISGEGNASPAVDYQIWFDGNLDLTTGKASSSFTFNSIELGPTSCTYSWIVSPN